MRAPSICVSKHQENFETQQIFLVMSRNNVPILSLLEGAQRPDDNHSAQQPQILQTVAQQSQTGRVENAPRQSSSSSPPPAPMANNIQSLISQYQTSVSAPAPLPTKDLKIVHERDLPNPAPQIARPIPPSSLLQNFLKNFQTSFNVTPETPNNEPGSSPKPSSRPTQKSALKSATKSTPKSARSSPAAQTTSKLVPLKPAILIDSTHSRTSINSLINSDEVGQAQTKKRPVVKVEGPSKKQKTEPSKKSNKQDSKTETKKGTKGKKKTPDVITPQEKPSIHPTMTADRSENASSKITLPATTFIEPKSTLAAAEDTHQPAGLELTLQSLGDAEITTTKNQTTGVDTTKEKEKVKEKEKEKKDKDENDKDKEKEKEKEKEPVPEPPVIALNIPLLDPKNPQPGQAEVIINVLKLAEDKYGWNVIHPNAKSAIDLMDEILDDDDEGEDEEEDDISMADDRGNLLTSKKKEELTEEQLIKRHETKMNRKVGKYDYEDPFIDDAELQWEEEITTTKEGFFVYWGPLVEERSATKKGASKSKK